MRLDPWSRAFAVSFLSLSLMVPAAISAQSSNAQPAEVQLTAAGAVAMGAMPDAPDSQPAHLSGTVTDTNDDIVPGASVVLEKAGSADRRSATSNDNGFFSFDGLSAGATYTVSISAQGFDTWMSQPVVPASGQFVDLTDVKLRLEAATTSITVTASQDVIATQQVQVEEQQRVLGFIPNFYVVYDAKDAVPLTKKLKFQMAYRVSIDPVSIVGAAALAGMNQAGDRPNYRQGWGGYGQRFGAAYADGLTDILFGGAILPSLLHQDPRYFYQGTGPVKSRLIHALSNPFICRGDNGHLQPNISSIGGDLISSAISNAYYPDSNRGLGLTMESVGLSTAERMVSSVVQEFVLRKLTPSAKRQRADDGIVK